MRVLAVVVICIALGTGFGFLLVGYDLGKWGNREASKADEAAASDLTVKPGVPPPVAVAPVTEFDFGTVKQGEHVSHSFVIRNEGAQNLLLRASTEKSCSCTQISVPEIPIPPGEEVKVDLEVTGKLREAEVREFATVLTNDLHNPSIRFTITGRQLIPIELSPEEIVFRNLVVGESAREEVRIYCHHNSDLKIDDSMLANEETAKFFELSVQPLPALELELQNAKSGYVVALVAKPGLPRGPIQQRIRLRTNDTQVPEIDIPVGGEVAGAIVVSGRGWNTIRDVLQLSAAELAEGASRDLLLRVQGPGREKSKLEIIERTPSSIEASLSDLDQSDSRVLKSTLSVKIPAGLKPLEKSEVPNCVGEIVMSTGHPLEPTLRIPIVLK